MKKYIKAAEEKKVGPLTISDNVVVKCDRDYAGHVDIPHGVTSIGDYTFYNCTGLTSVTIPDSVTKIGDSAFTRCDVLKSVTIPDSVTEINDYAFQNCTSLTSVTIPDSVTKLGDMAFSGCSSLTSVTIPDSVTEIGMYAFEDCTGLTSVIIGDGVTTIGKSAFADCTSLTRVVIPASATRIYSDAFDNTPFGRTYYGKSTDERIADKDDEDDVDFDLDTWEDICEALERDCDDCDPLYELTDAGERINDICQEVESNMGILLEPSIQAGQGGIWVYDSNDQCIASDIDYGEFNSDVVGIALNSSSEEAFKKSYKKYLKEQIEAHPVDED